MASIGNELKNRNYDIGRFFGMLPTWALYVFIVLVSVGVIALGAWIGYIRYQSGLREPEAPIDTAVAAILGLLAFMLGFTFSLTWSRFANRNSMIMSQAKTLTACYLRTSLIPEEQKHELRMLLREYLNVLLEIQNLGEIEKGIARIEELQVLIWNQTATLVQEEMDSELRSLFTSAVNDLFSLYIERKTIALVYRIPDAIWSSLLFLAGMGMFAFGYQTGMSGMRRIFQMPFIPIAFSVVIVLIADLNATFVQRRFKVSKKPLLDVQDLMAREFS